MKGVIGKLRVEVDRMKEVLDSTGGTFFAQRLLLALIKKGTAREDAYKLVQKLAFKAKESGQSFEALARKDAQITKRLSEAELSKIFSLEQYLEGIEVLYKRMNL
jgi:adenylosuccinate lyase